MHVWCPSFMATTEGTPLDSLDLRTRGACDLGSHETITIRETILARLPWLGCGTDSGLKHIPSVSKKEACVFQEL